MARYIDAKQIRYCWMIDADGKEHDGVTLQSVINKIPTADVVPKSEVERLQIEIEALKIANEKMYSANKAQEAEIERLQEEVNRYKRYYFRHDYDEMIAEVLDKLDRFINSNCIEIKDERGIKGYVTSGVHFAIAELKKKYTEGKHDAC